jgi:hypothetical protein
MQVAGRIASHVIPPVSDGVACVCIITGRDAFLKCWIPVRSHIVALIIRVALDHENVFGVLASCEAAIVAWTGKICRTQLECRGTVGWSGRVSFEALR